MRVTIKRIKNKLKHISAINKTLLSKVLIKDNVQ